MSSSPTANRPSHKQLAYLRSLAQRTGQTFTYPHTNTQASLEIRRLKAQNPISRVVASIERHAVCRELAERPHDAARVRQDEITGYGANASWR